MGFDLNFKLKGLIRNLETVSLYVNITVWKPGLATL